MTSPGLLRTGTRSTVACLSFYMRWGVPLCVLAMSPTSLATSLALWSRLQRADEPRHQRIDAAQFLAILGYGKLIVGRGKWWRFAAPATSLFFPWWALVNSMRAVVRHGRRARDTSGKSLALQFFEQLEIYVRRPGLMYLSERRDWYYRKRLYEIGDELRWKRSYPNAGALCAVANQLWHDSGTNGARARLDKEATRLRLQRASVPTIETIARLGLGEVDFEPPFRADAPPAVDLFAKPVDGRQGRGAKAWTRAAGGRSGAYRDHAGAETTWPAIIEELRTMDTRYVLQPRLRNHPDLVDLTGDTLASARLVTYVDPETRSPVVLAAPWMKVPSVGAIVDNVHAPGAKPGMLASIDVASGALGRAFSEDLTYHDVHPERATPITGRRLPDWERMLEIVVRAHGAFRDDFLAIGWDVAPTPNGPVIIEGNPQPGVHEEAFFDEFFGDLVDIEKLIELCLRAESSRDARRRK